MEFPPEPLEFDWWQVHGKHIHWRMGERVTLLRDDATQKSRLLAFSAVAALFVLLLAKTWLMYSDGTASGLVVVILLIVQSLLFLGALAGVIWYFGSRTVTIDWEKKQITARRAFVVSRFPFSALRSIHLKTVALSPDAWAELHLVFSHGAIQLMESYLRDEVDEAIALLVTLGRRLSESLGVPLQSVGDVQKDLRLGLSDKELASKYYEQGNSMALRYSAAELEGDEDSARQYYDEALFHLEYARRLDPEDTKPVIELARLSKEYERDRRFVDQSLGNSKDDVDALLERGHTHFLAGHVELAEADFNRAVELERSHKTLSRRGISLYFLDRFEDALRDFDVALRFQPDDAGLHHWRYDCWRRIFLRSSESRHRDYALEALDRAIELDPDNKSYLIERRKMHPGG